MFGTSFGDVLASRRGFATIAGALTLAWATGLASAQCSGDFNGDGFGTAVVFGDFNGDSRCDVVVGVPGDNVGAASNAGSITLLTPQFVQYVTQDTSGVSGEAGSGDGFGSSLSQRSR